MLQALHTRQGYSVQEIFIAVTAAALLFAAGAPAFIEAQTRAQISSTKSDMRVLASALEAYFLDEHQYPPDFSAVLRGESPVQGPIYRNYSTLVGRLSHLTTPVSYVYPLPENDLALPVAQGNGSSPSLAALYREGGTPTGAIIKPVAFDYAAFDRIFPPLDSESVWANITRDPENVDWALSSPGPVPGSFYALGFTAYRIYDPTNGTVSAGNILRTSLGPDDGPAR